MLIHYFFPTKPTADSDRLRPFRLPGMAVAKMYTFHQTPQIVVFTPPKTALLYNDFNILARFYHRAFYLYWDSNAFALVKS